MADQHFEMVQGGLMGCSMQEITKDQLQLFLIGQWGTDNHENLLTEWEEETDGPLPALDPEWDESPL